VPAAWFAGLLRIGSGWTGSNQRSFLSNGAVTIDAIDFHRSTRLVVDLSVAVIVLRKVAIVALHSF
jgi:hypothetical protein